MISAALSVRRYEEDFGIALCQNLGACVAKNDYPRPSNEHQQSSVARIIGCTHSELGFVRRKTDVGGAMTMYDDQIIPPGLASNACLEGLRAFGHPHLGAHVHPQPLA